MFTQDQFGINQSLQRSPIAQTSFLVWPFFALTNFSLQVSADSHIFRFKSFHSHIQNLSSYCSHKNDPSIYRIVQSNLWRNFVIWFQCAPRRPSPQQPPGRAVANQKLKPPKIYQLQVKPVLVGCTYYNELVCQCNPVLKIFKGTSKLPKVSLRTFFLVQELLLGFFFF